jgi:hypothetical protein
MLDKFFWQSSAFSILWTIASARLARSPCVGKGFGGALSRQHHHHHPTYPSPTTTAATTIRSESTRSWVLLDGKMTSDTTSRCLAQRLPAPATATNGTLSDPALLTELQLTRFIEANAGEIVKAWKSADRGMEPKDKDLVVQRALEWLQDMLILPVHATEA